MTVIEAMEAFRSTTESIVAPLSARGLAVDTRFYYSDRELNEISDESSNLAAVIAAEIRINDGATGAEMMLEAAVAIEDGDVLNDEIIREATTMRANVKDIMDALDSNENPKDAFDSLIPSEEYDQQTQPAHNNMPYYIGGAVVVLLILLAALLFGK